MTSRKLLHRRPLAIRDIANHSDAIAAHSLRSGQRFLDAVEATVELLCQFPEAGGVVQTSRPDANGLRAKLVSGFANYVALYFISDDAVDIARVIRGGQEIDAIAFNFS